MTFGAKPSTGLMLPVLCFADVIGVSYYRRQAEWNYIIRLLPMAIAGFFLALWVDNMIPASEFKHLMGACLALVLAVMLWSQWKGKENLLIDKWWYSPLFGLLGGFTTMIGNPFVLIGAFLGIRLVKFLPEKGFRIFTTIVTIISVLVMLLT